VGSVNSIFFSISLSQLSASIGSAEWSKIGGRQLVEVLNLLLEALWYVMVLSPVVVVVVVLR
jgi:hypothetical protein